MKIQKSSFLKIYETRFWKKLKESLVPFINSPTKSDFLEELYTEITDFTYTPLPPRDYIVVNKHNGISRYIPTFTRKDYCVYYLCIKLLENEIAINRIDGTFGGWTLGNPIRLKEEEEILELEYIPFNTINELAWVQEWQSFQSIAKRYRDLEDWKFIINLDIANFYDSINLAVLERKIRHTIPKEKQDVVTLLFHFLRNWNKRLEGYGIKTVGLPQDEIGDCSRILANFYLQDYDKIMSDICSKYGAKFIRFADDQIIYARDKSSCRKILFEASKELLRLNLNLNSGKVKEFNSINEFNKYWAFCLFDLLRNTEDETKINLAIEQYFLHIENSVSFREHSILKRILSQKPSLINKINKEKLINVFLHPDFMSQLNTWHFKKIREFINNDEDFYTRLDKLIDEVPFNNYHYNLLKFYKKERPEFDLKILETRIENLKLK